MKRKADYDDMVTNALQQNSARFSQDKRLIDGLTIFEKFRKFELTKQMRCSDKVHASHVEDFRTRDAKQPVCPMLNRLRIHTHTHTHTNKCKHTSPGRHTNTCTRAEIHASKLSSTHTISTTQKQTQNIPSHPASKIYHVKNCFLSSFGQRIGFTM